jgi:hypothetical protein
MKSSPSLAFLLLLAALAPVGRAASCCSGHDDNALAAAAASVAVNPTSAAAPEAARRHPLKGVIIAVLAEKSSLLVKHEEIPGVMKAMTMLLKVDAPTLAAAKKDQSITAMLVKKADGWWLEDVQPAPATE